MCHSYICQYDALNSAQQAVPHASQPTASRLAPPDLDDGCKDGMVLGNYNGDRVKGDECKGNGGKGGPGGRGGVEEPLEPPPPPPGLMSREALEHEVHTMRLLCSQLRSEV